MAVLSAHLPARPIEPRGRGAAHAGRRVIRTAWTPRPLWKIAPASEPRASLAAESASAMRLVHMWSTVHPTSLRVRGSW